MARVYIASSWKNETVIAALAEALRCQGHEVDAFCESRHDRYVFHWSEVGDKDSFNAKTFLENKQAQQAFLEDKKWLDWADTVVMLLPCGKSSHLEAGYARGQNKRLFIYGELKMGEFDVMYGFADGITDNIVELLKFLKHKEAR